MNWKPAVLSALIAVGCRAPVFSPENQAGVIVEDGDAKWAKDKIAEEYTRFGFIVKDSNDYGITVARMMDGDMLASVAYGSRMYTTPELRVHFSLSPQQDGLHITPDANIVTNPGSGFERVNHLSGGSGPAVDAQQFLETLIK